MIALVNFWLAAAIYVVWGTVNGSLTNTLSKFYSGCIAGLLLLTMASLAAPNLQGLQVLAWGGNVLYLGAMVGWMVSDMARGTAP
jgi:hypothetical protein